MKFHIEQRLRYIEARLQRFGYINRDHLVNGFRISLSQASIDFIAYKRLAPKNMIYNRAEHTYMIGAKFKPVFTK